MKATTCVFRPGFALLLLTARLGAADLADLKRQIPVPADQAIPLIDFFRDSVLRAPSINRAGTHIAGLVSGSEDKTDLFILDVATNEPQVWSAPGDRDVFAFDWLDDQRVMFYVGREKLYLDGVMVAGVARLDRPYALFQHCAAQLVSVPENDRLHPLFWVRVNIDIGNRRDGCVVRADSELNTGPMMRWGVGVPSGVLHDMVEQNNRHVMKAFPSPDGEIVAGYFADKMGELAFAYTSDSAGKVRLHRFVDGERWEKCPVNLDEIDVVGVGHEPGQLVVRGPFTEGKPQPLQFMDAVTGQLGAVLLSDEAYDFQGYLYRHPKSRQILGIGFQRNGPRMVWFDEGYRVIQKNLEAMFPGVVPRIIDSDEKENTLLVSTYSDRQPTMYYRVNLTQKSVSLIKASRPWLDPARMQPVTMMKYKTAEGRAIDAYVTLPAGASKTAPVPLIVLPHGGPWVRDQWGFDAEAQLLASRGYAVLQPNYRGSPGYDWLFPYTDRWEFRKMHDDVTAATKTLLKTGLIDPKRMAVMGGSFGAYLALSGAVHEPELYRCAVTIAGVFDWAQVLREEKYNQYDTPEFAVLRRWLGDPKVEREKYAAISPLTFLKNARIPIFVAHGKEDSVASVEQARALLSGLARYRIPHEEMIVSGEGHGMGHLKNQVELYTRILGFLGKNL